MMSDPSPVRDQTIKLLLLLRLLGYATGLR
jgi:hypothetical protein